MLPQGSAQQGGVAEYGAPTSGYLGVVTPSSQLRLNPQRASQLRHTEEVTCHRAFLDADLARISLNRPARNRSTQRSGRSGGRMHNCAGKADAPYVCQYVGGEPGVQVCGRAPVTVGGLFCGHFAGILRAVCGQSAGQVCGHVCGRLCGPYVIDLRDLRALGGQVRAPLREVRAKCGQGLASAGAPAGRVRELRASAGRVCGTSAGGDVKFV
eukprot:gene12670-biopygen1380